LETRPHAGDIHSVGQYSLTLTGCRTIGLRVEIADRPGTPKLLSQRTKEARVERCFLILRIGIFFSLVTVGCGPASKWFLPTLQFGYRGLVCRGFGTTSVIAKIH
jgi:hypothetical protein